MNRRTITITDWPNDQGFSRFTVTQENGKPYLENPVVMGINDPVGLFRALVEWLEGKE